MPKDLRSAIRQLAGTFAQGVLDVVCAASLDEIRTNGVVSPRPHGPGRRRPRKLEGAPPRRSEKSRAPSDVTVKRIVFLVGNSPNGVRSEELRAWLGLERVAFREAAAKAVAANLIVRRGTKRTTTFLPV
ncbi:hypothetical protein [Pendulispora albinea]|uniref:Uncharacterized protein n=1 Tax=Pendulispora albinea TaxID=2741071 RepID=A0ABZ2M6P7_9BACT